MFFFQNKNTFGVFILQNQEAEENPSERPSQNTFEAFLSFSLQSRT